MNREQFRQLLGARPYLLDGAMGTYLHSRGVSADHSFENINLQQPALVAEIHRHYIEAGADIIETNTFSANRYKLAEHGLQDQVAQINRTAVDIAHRAIESSFKPVLLAGSVGPLGARLAPLGRVTKTEAQAAFHEQIEALINAPRGVDLLVLETMSDMYEVETAVAAARAIAPDVPIVATLTFTRDDRTLLGYTADVVARQLAELDVDVMGVNCSGGPAQVLRLVMIMHRIAPERLIAAMPNAGWPEVTASGRVLYPATPDYFGEYALKLTAAGASLVGGCCGTTEAHISAMRRALDGPRPAEIHLPVIEVVARDETVTGQSGFGFAVSHPPTQLARYLQNQTFVVTVEMRPPRGIATHRLLQSARMLQEAGANLLNIADTPVAQMRMSAWAAAYLVQKEIGLDTVLHFPTRGRNLLRIQGDLLAAHALGIRNLFVTMGDPTRIGDYPEAMDSYDIVPTGLIQLIKQQFNTGLQHSGASINEPTSFVVGCALSLTPPDPEKEARLLHKKIQHGADFALTQPVFDPAAAKEFVAVYERLYGALPIPIVAGLYPLYNGRNAEFLHNEVPGMVIPEAMRQRMHNAADPQQEGVLMAQEILAGIRPLVQGVYLMPAFGRYDLVADVLDGMK